MRCLGTVAVFVLAGLFAGCGEEAPLAEPPLRPVRYEEVAPTGADRVRTFSGAARAGAESRLSFRVAGSVESIAVSVGQRVAAGEVLARLDDTDYRLQVQEAEAGIAQAEATLRNAESEYERVRALYENNNASRSQLDAARAATESSRAQLEGARNRLQLARSQLGYTVLRAPVDGAIAAVNVEENENLQPGAPVVLLASGGELEVQFAVPEVLITEVEEGDQVEVTFGALSGLVFAATVTEVGVASTGTATTFPVIARLDSGGDGVRSGMAAEVAVRFSSGGGDRLIVPTVSVGEDRSGRFVFVVEPTSDSRAIVRRRAVGVGELTSEGLEIVSGLESGELIATAGVRRLVDGLEVALLEPPQ